MVLIFLAMLIAGWFISMKIEYRDRLHEQRIDTVYQNTEK
jgi:hypothetical protein